MSHNFPFKILKILIGTKIWFENSPKKSASEKFDSSTVRITKNHQIWRSRHKFEGTTIFEILKIFKAKKFLIIPPQRFCSEEKWLPFHSCLSCSICHRYWGQNMIRIREYRMEAWPLKISSPWRKEMGLLVHCRIQQLRN